MLAKLIVWAPDRLQVLARMSRALNELVIMGVATNQGFHRRLVADGAFARGEIDIQFLDRRPDLTGPDRTLERVEHLAIAAALAEDSARQSRLPLVAADTSPASEWARQARSEALR
jgi:acetyl/propionyl-CoA carboxylase alpha subunit